MFLPVEGRQYRMLSFRGRRNLPLTVPLTLVTVRPLTKVTYESAGTLFMAVKVTVAPADGAEQLFWLPWPFHPPFHSWFPMPSRLTYSLGLPQLGSSQVQDLPSYVKEGNAVNGSAVLVDGQLVIKAAARV